MGMNAFCSVALVVLSLNSHLPPTQSPESIASLVAEALKSNPAILAAGQKVAESESHLAEMQGHRKLQLSLNGTISGSTGQVAQPPSAQSFGTAEASLVAPVPNFARSGAEVDQAAANVDVAKSQFRRAQLDIEFKTTSAVFELRRSRDSVTIAQENLDQSVRQAKDTQTRIAAGDLPPADLLKAQVPVAQNRAALERAKAAGRVATQNLNDLLQRDLNSALDVSTQFQPTFPTSSSAKAVAQALSLSPDITEASAAIKASEANERIVRRGRDPDFALQLTHTRTGDPTAYGYLSTLGLTIGLPLADGGVNREQVRQARLQTEQARTALKLAQQRTRLSVEQALLDIEADSANIQATSATEDIARQSLEKSRQSYIAGLTTTRDVLDAQLVYSQSLIESNSARYDLAIAQARLRQLIGAPPR